jgi:hypothetical protein
MIIFAFFFSIEREINTLFSIEYLWDILDSESVSLSLLLDRDGANKTKK